MTTTTKLRKGQLYNVDAPGTCAYGTQMRYIGRFNGYAAFRPKGLSDTVFVDPGGRVAAGTYFAPREPTR